MITIVALGLKRAHLTLEAAEALTSGMRVILRTGQCEAAAYLTERNIPFETMDDLYESSPDFDALNATIVQRIAGAAGDIVYGVLDLRDETVRALCETLPDQTRMVQGVPVDAPLYAYARGAVAQVAAADIADFQPHAAMATLVREISSQTLAGEVKLKLLERYNDDWQVMLLTGAAEIRALPLDELDRQASYDHKTAVYVPEARDLVRLTRYGFDELNRVVRLLRSPEGCPWDRKQTHETLRNSLLEESYEVVEAVNEGDMDALYEELGDVLLQVALHAEIARQHGEFVVDDITSGICRKLIERHEHVFGTAKADTPEEVLRLWDAVKLRERKQTTQSQAMHTVAKALPALVRANKLQKKATNVGFNWADAAGAACKIEEETKELLEAIRSGVGFEEELGDLLFSAANVGMLNKVDAETALARANDKFVDRFTRMEALIRADGKALEDMTLEQMDEYWDRIKK